MILRSKWANAKIPISTWRRARRCPASRPPSGQQKAGEADRRYYGEGTCRRRRPTAKPGCLGTPCASARSRPKKMPFGVPGRGRPGKAGSRASGKRSESFGAEVKRGRGGPRHFSEGRRLERLFTTPGQLHHHWSPHGNTISWTTKGLRHVLDPGHPSVRDG